MAEVRESGKFTTVHRDDGKIVVASQEVFSHIGLHGKLGAGSIFSGGITPEMITEFLQSASIPKTGGGIPADFPGGGYLLVKPFDSAMQLQDATVKEGQKENFDPKQKKMVPVPVAEVHTSQPLSDFATDITTVLVFPYDPNRSSDVSFIIFVPLKDIFNPDISNNAKSFAPSTVVTVFSFVSFISFNIC